MLGAAARSQFRAISYRQISARISHAVAKASVMRLLGVTPLPLPRQCRWLFLVMLLLETALARPGGLSSCVSYLFVLSLL